MHVQCKFAKRPVQSKMGRACCSGGTHKAIGAKPIKRVGGSVVRCDGDNVVAGQEVGVDPHPDKWALDDELLADLYL